MNSPKVETKSLGTAEVGTYVGTETDAMGTTRKVVVDDAVVNEALCPPPGMDNAVLVGAGRVNVNVRIDHTPIVVDGNRLRSSNVVIETTFTPMTPGTVGKGIRPNL